MVSLRDCAELQIHLLYFTVTPIIVRSGLPSCRLTRQFAGIMVAANGDTPIAYIDALFMCTRRVSAVRNLAERAAR